MKYLGFLLIVLCATATPAKADEKSPLSRILFGSCIKQERPVPIFEAILERKPEAFLFIGDNIYADTEDMDVMAANYASRKVCPTPRSCASP